MLTISRHKYNNEALSDAELMARAPSIFASQPYEKSARGPWLYSDKLECGQLG